LPGYIDNAGTTSGYTGAAGDIIENVGEAAKVAGAIKAGRFIGYGSIGLGVASDIALSSMTDPRTGKPYQSWTETGANTSVAFSAWYLGGIPGIMIESDYTIMKGYQQYLATHPTPDGQQDADMWMQ